MQDRYTGDVGDFGKYGLLRALCRNSGLRLGVVWYLTLPEQHNSDGKHVTYLRTNNPEYRNCDPDLYDRLQRLIIDADGRVRSQDRRVALVETSGVLPNDTRYHSEILSFSSMSGRHHHRLAWFERAMITTADADVVFLDPDNGIECKSASRISRDGPKYVFWDETEQFLKRGQSLIIYHHLNRSCSSQEQIRKLMDAASRRTPHGYVTDALIYRRGTRRAYLVIGAKQHATLIDRMQRLKEPPWNAHFIPAESYNEL